MPPTMNDTVDNLAHQLEDHTIENEPESQVTFKNAAMKLNSLEDALPIVTAIRDCPNLKSFNLEGNTLGVDAAEAISQALTSAWQLKQAILKDIFTGRLKTEVPHAVRSLMVGIQLSKARLVELDLSDNAFGPIGMEALGPFLESESGEELRILKLNNNGLGIGGGKILGRALNNLKKLQIFVCGRNRLENPGAKEIGASLSNLDNIAHIEMPQNGINLPGIEALAKAVKPNIKVLSLNDNTMTEEGGRIIAEAIRETMPQLEVVNFADCLLKKEGFKCILDALVDTCLLENMVSLDISGNEIGGDDIVDRILEVFLDKTKDFSNLTLNLSSNCFGETNCQLLVDELSCQLQLILEEDEGGEDEYEYPEDYLEESAESAEPQSNEVSDEIRELVEDEDTSVDQLCSTFVQITIDGFNESTETLNEKTLNEADLLIKTIIMKCPSYNAAQALLVHMGLIKSEEGYHKKPKDLRGPFIALINSRVHLKKEQVDAFQILLGRPHPSADRTGKIKHKLLQALFVK